VSRPMRFPSRGRRVLLLLFGIALGPFLLALPATGWLVWTLSPLQKFYLGTYAASSLGSGQPRSVTSNSMGAEDGTETQIRTHDSLGCGRRTRPKAASQPLVSGPRGRLAGSGIESSGEGPIVSVGSAAPGFDVRRREPPAHPWDALALWIGGADLPVYCPAKGEGRMGLWTEFVGGAAA